MTAPTDSSAPDADLAAAWAEVSARGTQLRTDRRLAELALGLVEALGNGAAQRDLLKDLAKSWSEDAELTLLIASLLLAQAERRGQDEPIVSEDTPARWAADALQAAWSSLDDEARAHPEIAGSLQASLGNALRLCGPGEDQAARDAFGRALELDPGHGGWWFDLGLLHKWRGRFAEGVEANHRALAHQGPERASLWNLAICATGVGEGAVAQQAWSKLGVDSTTDDSTGMPFVDELEPMLVRVLSRPSATDGTSAMQTGVGFELVWVAPLSPCHGVVQSPTFRDAPIDFGDLVLWDGAPVAQHRLGGSAPIPVFPLLEILRRGDERRWPFVAMASDADGLRAIENTMPEDVHLFWQRERIEHQCAECEAGIPHEHEASANPIAPEGPSFGSAFDPGFGRGKLVLRAGHDLTEFRKAFESAASAPGTAVALPKLYEELGETKRAGQEHQAWRGIESKVLRRKASP